MCKRVCRYFLNDYYRIAAGDSCEMSEITLCGK